MQATKHAQQDAACAAEELAQRQLELSQSREAEQNALDARRSLEQERVTLLEALGKHKPHSSHTTLKQLKQGRGLPFLLYSCP